MVLNTLPNQVRKIGPESTTEINSSSIDISTGISRPYGLTVVIGVVQVKENSFGIIFVLFLNYRL